jgi:hypothetical protein
VSRSTKAFLLPSSGPPDSHSPTLIFTLVGFFSCVAREQKSSFSPDQGGKKSALINDSESIVELEREREREREREEGGRDRQGWIKRE